MKSALIIFAFFVVIPTRGLTQNLSYEDIYQLNTELAISSNYLSTGKLECAIGILKKLESNKAFLIQKNHSNLIFYRLAETYLKLGDSSMCEFYYLKTISTNYYGLIKELAQKSSPFNFIYLNNKDLMDSIYLRLHFDDKYQNLLSKNKENLIQMITIDQFARTELAQIIFNKLTKQDNDHNLNTIFKGIDSINTGKLLQMLSKDEMCLIAKHEFVNLYILNLHLSRYDTSTFTKLFDYNEKCLGKGNYLNSIILENRLFYKYHIQPIRIYLMQSNFSDKLNFEQIDFERRKLGIPSFFFDILKHKITMPDYYNDCQKRYFKCND